MDIKVRSLLIELAKEEETFYNEIQLPQCGFQKSMLHLLIYIFWLMSISLLAMFNLLTANSVSRRAISISSHCYLY